MNKFVLLFTCFMCSLSLTFSIDITEIQFYENEYVEIVINSSEFESFNNSKFKINDEGGDATFSKYQSHPNSSILLIAGRNFINNANSEYNISLNKLNCQIYKVDGTEVGYYGLHKDGENFTIQFNSQLNISYNSSDILSIEENETLHFNSTQTYENAPSPCELDTSQKNIYDTILEVTNQNSTNSTSSNESINSTTNSTNTSTPNFNQSTNSTSTNESNNSTNNQENVEPNCELNLEVDEIIEGTRIQFTFSGNTSLGVTYYVEDGAGNIVRNPFTSSTASSKSYTPRKNGKFVVQGEINDEKCNENIKVSNSTFFYNSELDKEEDDKDSDSSGSSSSTPRVERDTYINILQAVQINHNQIKLVVEASRGDSRSYRMKVNVNDEEVAQYDFGKYGNIDFEIPLTLETGKNTIEVVGFGEKDEVDITIEEVENNMNEKMENMIRDIVKEEQEELLKNSNSNSLITTNDETSTILRNSFNSNSSNSIPQSTVMIENTTTNSNNSSGEVNFSKHFFYQNTGVLFIVLGLVLVAGVIIILR